MSVEFVDLSSNPYCCQGYQQLRVFTERIQLLLKDVYEIPIKYSIFILKEALVGFKALNGYYGYFTISDKMIGFNSDDKVKVWMN